MSGGSVDLRIPRKAEWVAVARLTVAAIASRLRFTIEEIEDVKLAVAEACTNVIQASDGGAFVEIACDVDGERLRVSVKNSLDGEAPPKPPPVDDDVRVGGLGVFLIRSLMDEVEYEEGPDRATQLVMVKRLAS